MGPSRMDWYKRQTLQASGRQKLMYAHDPDPDAVLRLDGRPSYLLVVVGRLDFEAHAGALTVLADLLLSVYADVRSEE